MTVDEGNAGAHPRTGSDCLACYVRGQVETAGCDGTWRWVATWRAARSPSATALERRLARSGAACDCGLVHTLLAPAVDLWQLDGSGDRLREPTQAPRCLGMRPRSTAPCLRWTLRAAIRW